MSKLITSQGMIKLEEELRKLKYEEKPKVILAISEGRSHGDLKENAEYQTAKEKQDFLEVKIRKLEQMISESKIVDISSIVNTDVVQFGLYVEVLNLETDQVIKFQIVGEHESDFENKKISITSPLARSMLDKKVGDICYTKAPAGDIEYEILKIGLKD